MDQYYNDDYYYHDRPRRPRMSSQMGGGVYHLSPSDPYVVGDLHRSRSHGHVRAPDVHIYNDINAQARADPVMVAPPSPRGRRVDLVDLSYQQAYRPYSQTRSHSYSRSRSRDRDRIIADYRREQEEFEKEKERAIQDYENKKAADAKAAKEAQAEAVRKHLENEQKKKDADKAAQLEALRQVKEKEEKEAERKKKEDEAYQERVRKDLARFGFQDNQIKAMIKSEEEKKKELAAAGTVGSALAIRPLGAPVYPKIRRKDIALETLRYYDLAWEYDSRDSDYIIILQEMSERDTDMLFAHTRRERDRTTLFIEDRGRDKPQYQFVRRKSRGKSPKREKVAARLFAP